MSKVDEILASAKYLDGVGMPQTATWLREFAAVLTQEGAEPRLFSYSVDSHDHCRLIWPDGEGVDYDRSEPRAAEGAGTCPDCATVTDYRDGIDNSEFVPCAKHTTAAAAVPAGGDAEWIEWNGQEETPFREAVLNYGMRCVFADRERTHQQNEWKQNAFERVITELRKLTPPAAQAQDAGEPK